ncbi:GNAT family N-acetyltransferase [Bradyrhizobium sp. McL0615]|jgi:GNAT superfamily N-acetyltransferase|uniref:GNAT family N-acetyltransferase n=1 Tax=Bradyrhizobium sp. McL0615 TaxID=3415673 RepID=UPI003CF48040
MNRIEITRLHELPSVIEPLRTDAARQGFRFVERLVSDWTSGANTFGQPGERILGAFTDAMLVGVGGLNRDPYAADPAVGRIRHLYVRSDHRRSGIGRAMVDHLLNEARLTFSQVRLRTDTEEAARFYLRCGFSPRNEPTASHGLDFGTGK